MARNDMERPFAVCHMLASLDGKIDGAFFGVPETAPALKVYGELRGFYGCQATVYGTTTMLGGYADGAAPELDPAEPAPAGEDWINPQGKAMGNFIVSLDPKGELAFSGHVLEKKGRPAAHVIEAVTEQASPKYLSYLRRLGISYLTVGDERLDCTSLARKLRSRFGIERLMVAGGGMANWSFLQEGLIDEFSLVIAPVADGGSAASSFERAPFLPPHGPVAFRIKDVKLMDSEVLWLRYETKR